MRTEGQLEVCYHHSGPVCALYLHFLHALSFFLFLYQPTVPMSAFPLSFRPVFLAIPTASFLLSTSVFLLFCSPVLCPSVFTHHPPIVSLPALCGNFQPHPPPSCPLSICCCLRILSHSFNLTSEQISLCRRLHSWENVLCIDSLY